MHPTMHPTRGVTHKHWMGRALITAMIALAGLVAVAGPASAQGTTVYLYDDTEAWWNTFDCAAWKLMHPLILQHQITPKTSRYTRCSMSMLPNVSINGRIRSSGQLGRWWYSISPCRNSECVRRFTVFAFNQRS